MHHATVYAETRSDSQSLLQATILCATPTRTPPGQMAVAPTSTLTRRVSRSNKPYALLALAYGVALAASWQADTLQLMMPGSLAEGFKGERWPSGRFGSTEHELMRARYEANRASFAWPRAHEGRAPGEPACGGRPPAQPGNGAPLPHPQPPS